MTSITPILLDCDTGVDDALAIAYAALSPGIDLVAVGSVWGNIEVEQATRNSLHVLDLAGASDVPVAPGSAGPIDGSPAVYAHHVHGPDGQGGAAPQVAARHAASRSAAEQMIDVCRNAPGEIEIVAVGPLTNVAVALALDPELPKHARGLTIMGGAALAPGNVTPMAEANIWCDPVAARAAFEAPWSVTVMPLDVTMRVRLTEAHRTRLAAADGRLGPYLAGALDFYFGFFEKAAFGERQSAMHDVLAVAVAAGHLVPILAPVVSATVDTSWGPSRGATICDLRGRYMGYPEQPDGRARVVLEVPSGFEEVVVSTLIEGSARVG
jgi:purine nucleosidase